MSFVYGEVVTAYFRWRLAASSDDTSGGTSPVMQTAVMGIGIILLFGVVAGVAMYMI
jgi:Ni,Fe-hydrogenase I cytochrome b subunit